MSWRRLEVDRTACAICSATAALAPPPPPAATGIPGTVAARSRTTPGLCECAIAQPNSCYMGQMSSKPSSVK